MMHLLREDAPARYQYASWQRLNPALFRAHTCTFRRKTAQPACDNWCLGVRSSDWPGEFDIVSVVHPLYRTTGTGTQGSGKPFQPPDECDAHFNLEAEASSG